MSIQGTADLIEENVETIKKTISHLKKKDKEILDILLKTKSLLDRQKIEDIKLSVSSLDTLTSKRDLSSCIVYYDLVQMVLYIPPFNCLLHHFLHYPV